MTLLRKTAKLPLQVSNQLFDAARRVGIRRDLPASWRYRRIFICSSTRSFFEGTAGIPASFYKTRRRRFCSCESNLS